MSKKNENIWIPFADLMTSLMLIFLLIVVLIFSIIPQEDITNKVELESYKSVLDDLYKELNNAFTHKQEEWGIRVLQDLTIKFENPDILFDRDSPLIKEDFKSILDEFIPQYLSILNKEKYKEKIKEIKIEGHTAAESTIYNTYIKTVRLSQERSLSILQYIRESQYFKNLDKDSKDTATFLLSANGFGYGRAIDSSNNFVYNTKHKISSNSRRVEFKIITNSEELIKNLIKNQ